MFNKKLEIDLHIGRHLFVKEEGGFPVRFQAQKKHDQDSAIDVDHVVINRISYMVFMLLFIAICNFGIKSKTNKFNLLERNGYESNL